MTKMTQTLLDDIKNAISSKGLLIPLDILIVGATGTGKSSTINAIFNKNIAQVGSGVDPMTQHIEAYSLNKHLRFHDSAGLGDSPLNDLEHKKNIIQKLAQKASVDNKATNYGFIDLALIILDGSSRDLGTALSLLEEVIIPNIETSRIIVALNQADMAMKGRNWDHHKNEPDQMLYTFLNEQSENIRSRLLASTKKVINLPVYYSAAKNFNIEGLIGAIFKQIPNARRTI